jgi:hypothetical protein
MKFKYLVYGFLILAAGFVGVMVFLVYNYRSTLDTGQGSIQAVSATTSTVRDQGKTVSGKAGKVIIAYAGDIEGSLDPCG